MKKEDFSLIEGYMQTCMLDSAHDKEHVYRVLYVALDIAQSEEKVNTDILIAACLLHDIGRKEQFENPLLCHAKAGAEKAFRFLTENGFDKGFAESVADCISTHRFRGDNPPESVEAKILFDADKIDVTGALGIARTIFYQGNLNEPLYTLDENGCVSDGEGDKEPSFFQEYKFKLEKVYSKLITKRGREIAAQRKCAAEAFYNSLYAEVNSAYNTGKSILKDKIET